MPLPYVFASGFQCYSKLYIRITLYCYSIKMLKHEQFMEDHPQVKVWLQNRPEQTRRKFAGALKRFCESVGISPEEWRDLDKNKARDIAWTYVFPKIKDHSTVAKSDLLTLKSWYRNKDGEQLPFDSGKGGKHHFQVSYKKPSYEHIPSKKEMYNITDMASSLRDKAILLLLFQSGVRVNVLEHLAYGDVEEQLDKDIMTLKITPRLDYKLRGRNIPYYYTFINGEGAETLRKFCELKHKNSAEDTPLFPTKGNKAITQKWVLKIVKMCVERAGLNPLNISTHTLRKAFRKIVRQTPIDDDDKEQLMGHVIPGSRSSYYDRKDVDLIREAYLKCNFTREVPESKYVEMKNELEQLRSLPGMVEELRRELAAMKNELRILKKS